MRSHVETARPKRNIAPASRGWRASIRGVRQKFWASSIVRVSLVLGSKVFRCLMIEAYGSL